MVYIFFSVAGADSNCASYLANGILHMLYEIFFVFLTLKSWGYPIPVPNHDKKGTCASVSAQRFYIELIELADLDFGISVFLQLCHCQRCAADSAGVDGPLECITPVQFNSEKCFCTSSPEV